MRMISLSRQTRKELLENEIKPMLVNFFKERGLRLSEEKTIITHIREGFNFLGDKHAVSSRINWSLNHQLNLLNQCWIKSENSARKNKQTKTENIIRNLNPIIRGRVRLSPTLNMSSGTFKKIDGGIFKILWRWAKRRHPNKGPKWVKNKYFQTHQSRNWVFPDDSGKLHLLKMRLRQKSKDTSKSNRMPTRSTWSGNTTLKNGKRISFLKDGKAKYRLITSKRGRTTCVRSAVKKFLRIPGNITSSNLGRMEDLLRIIIW